MNRVENNPRKKKHYAMSLLVCLTALMSACTKHELVNYSPGDFVNPNRVVTERISSPIPQPKINATFGMGNNPAVLKAYTEFSKKGIAKTISSSGFKTIGYDAYSHPIVDCAPLHLCIIQLERQEHINNIDLGDSSHWMVGTSLIGTTQDGSYSIAIKPKLYGIATDMVINTNKRTYNIGLVSKRGSTTHVVNFYYPQETLGKAIKDAKAAQSSPDIQRVVSQSSAININHINFNYSLSGDEPSWTPSRVFDDGHKTFIQMPGISSEMDLPVLYLLRNGQMQMVNYRYKKPYYIVDGLFKAAYLISGKGSDEIRVVINNRNFS